VGGVMMTIDDGMEQMRSWLILTETFFFDHYKSRARLLKELFYIYDTNYFGQ
jgi:hypothetical protein